MQSSIIIEGITKAEFLSEVKRIVTEVLSPIQKESYSIKELSKLTGYSRPHLRKLLKEGNVPYHYDGREIMVPKEFVGRIKSKM